MANASNRRVNSQVFLRYWLPVLAYVATIFSLSAQPHLAPPLHFQNSDKVMHLLEYGVLGVLLARAARVSMPDRSLLAVALVTLGLGMGIGAGDEVFQSYVPGRDSSLFDWFADSTGLTFAQILWLTFTRHTERHD